MGWAAWWLGNYNTRVTKYFKWKNTLIFCSWGSNHYLRSATSHKQKVSSRLKPFVTRNHCIVHAAMCEKQNASSLFIIPLGSFHCSFHETKYSTVYKKVDDIEQWPVVSVHLDPAIPLNTTIKSHNQWDVEAGLGLRDFFHNYLFYAFVSCHHPDIYAFRYL